jgi:hypothetical protein
MFWAIVAENREAEINLVLRSIPFSRNKQRKKYYFMISSIQNWNPVSRGYRDTANLEPWIVISNLDQFIRNLPRENITFSSSEYNNVTLANTTKLVREYVFVECVWIRTGLHPSDRKCETINYVMEMKFDRSRPEVFSASLPPKSLTPENLWTPGY